MSKAFFRIFNENLIGFNQLNGDLMKFNALNFYKNLTISIRSDNLFKEVMELGVRVKRDVFENLLDDWAGSNITEFAKKLGVSRNYIYQILYYDLNVGKRFIDKALEATGMNFEDLFYYHKDEETQVS